MSGQRCATCKQQNPAGYSHCQSCGAPLISRSVVVPQSRPVVLSKPQLPARQLKRLGASVAVGAVALLVEMGFIYMRRRVQGLQGPLLPSIRRKKLPAAVAMRSEEKQAKGKRVVTVFSERVVEERRWGRPMRRIVDRMAWRSEETLES